MIPLSGLITTVYAANIKQHASLFKFMAQRVDFLILRQTDICIKLSLSNYTAVHLQVSVMTSLKTSTLDSSRCKICAFSDRIAGWVVSQIIIVIRLLV